MLLQHTAANRSNIGSISTTKSAELFSNVSSQLDGIMKILNANFTCIDENVTESFYNQKFINNSIETQYQNSQQWFAGIGADLVRLEMES